MTLAISGVRKRQRRRRPIQEQRFLNPGKGINVFVSEQLIQDQEGSGSMNANIIESGAISKRYGWEEVGTGFLGTPRGLASYYPTGNDPLLCSIDSSTNHLRYLDASDNWTEISTIDFTDSDRIDWVQAAGKLFIHNGQDAAAQLDNLTLSRPTTTVKSNFGIYYADRQIVSGVPAQPNRLYMSSSTDVADFTNANPTGTGAYSAYTVSTHPGASTFAGSDADYLDVAKDDGDHITGLAKYQSKLIIFKERSIYSLEFDSTGNPVVKLVTNAIGCVSHWSIDQVDNDIIFLSRRGFYVLGTEPNFFDQIRTNELSIRIKPFVDAITPMNLDRAAGIWHDNTYYCAVPVGNASVNNKIFTYHRQYTGWLQSNNRSANAWTQFIDTDNVEKLYYADDQEAKIWVQTTGYNDGTDPIDMYWESKAHDFNQFDVVKTFVDVTLLFRQLRGSVTVTITIDGNRVTKNYRIPGSSFSGGLGRAGLGRASLGGVSEASSGDTVSSATTNVPIRLDIGETGRTIKIKVSNGNVAENFVLLGYNIGYRASGRNNFPAELRVYA